MLAIAAAVFFGLGIDSSRMRTRASKAELGGSAAVALRHRPARLGLLLVLGRHDGGPGRHAGLHPPADPALPPARDHAGPGADRPAVGVDPSRALVLSQVVLSFGIPFALVPLVFFTSRRDLMGVAREHAADERRRRVGSRAVIVCLNVFLLYETFLREPSGTLRRHARQDHQFCDEIERGFGWIAEQPGSSSGRPMRSTLGRPVSLFDPVDVPGIDERIRALGEPEASSSSRPARARSRRGRGSARRVRICGWSSALMVRAAGLSASSGTAFWKEVAFWEPERRVLVVADALGAVGYFAAPGEAIGVHPLLCASARRAISGSSSRSTSCAGTAPASTGRLRLSALA